MAAIVDVASVAEKQRNASSEPAARTIRLWRERVNTRLEEHIRVDEDACPTLVEAMRYSLLTPGKRVRPLLALLTALDFGRDPRPLIDFGCALELVHCASLMLDDLPCMDNARMRRGQPAAHIQFGEATTTLAAIALLNQAFGVIASSSTLAESIRCQLVARVSQAVGTAGLVSGQSRDLVERKGGLDSDGLERINQQKTGVLFELAVVGGGMIVDLPPERLDALNRYAGHVGQAFQSADDLLDCRKHSRNSGKDCGADVEKAGSVHQLGESALRERLQRQLALADDQLAHLGLDQSLLRAYVLSLFQRLF
ncbi:MAG TPA: polyprenyl synthetase family protein [Wenzhouxiangellaceae bacterium]|nr:polyprenyl synthetase family protein [Wenzhouxiangellaceae bacterium]